MSESVIDPTPLHSLACVHLPHDPEYTPACVAWNVAVAQRPAAVAVPRSIDEVVRVVREAVAAGMRIAPQATGHAASALAPDALDGVLLLRLDGLIGVTVDPDARTARILGGTLWNDVLAAAAPHGLTAMHGSAGDVSAVGYLLGGGLSFYGRSRGLATSTIRSVDLVTPDGELRHVSAADDTDLFWALRGGGGRFGVVVAIEIDLLPLAEVYAGFLLWDIERAPEVLDRWADWAATAPEEATTSFRIFRFPPLPELPPFLSGRSLVIVDGAVLGPDPEAVIAPLRELEPEMDTFASIPSSALVMVHLDPPQPTPVVADHALFSGLPASAREALLRVAGPGVDSPTTFVELRQLGGALGRPADAALPALDGAFLLFALAITPSPDDAAEGLLGTAEVVEALRPWATRGTYSNFNDRPCSERTDFPIEGLDRLRRVRDRLDPDRVLVVARPID